jgi:hypothetical protein
VLISKYIGTIPLSSDGLATEHNDDPSPRIAVTSAMIANVGAAARYSRLADRSAAAFPRGASSNPPAQS